jgi:CBS domain-containing protein
MNISIATILEQKGGKVHTVSVSVTVAEAVQQMNRHKIGSVLVMDGARLAGIFTERDVLTRVIGADQDPKRTAVSTVMTADVITISPSATVQQVMDTFSEKRCRHLPVVDQGKLVGLISIGDVSRWVAGMHRAEAESLRQYISGGFSG